MNETIEKITMNDIGLHNNEQHMIRLFSSLQAIKTEPFVWAIVLRCMHPHAYITVDLHMRFSIAYLQAVQS